MPADGMSAADKNRDFGTSRWQLADELNGVRNISGAHPGRKGGPEGAP